MKDKDKPHPVKTVQILQDLLLQPICKFQCCHGQLSCFTPFQHRALMGRIDAALIGRKQDTDGATGKGLFAGHGAEC